jgi:glycyl-tRNA synthetase alpha subunit
MPEASEQRLGEDAYRLDDYYRSSVFLAPDRQSVNCSAYESAYLDRLGGLNLNISVNQINVMSLPG